MNEPVKGFYDLHSQKMVADMQVKFLAWATTGCGFENLLYRGFDKDLPWLSGENEMRRERRWACAMVMFCLIKSICKYRETSQWSHALIAKHTGLGRRRVTRCLRDLTLAGYLIPVAKPKFDPLGVLVIGGFRCRVRIRKWTDAFWGHQGLLEKWKHTKLIWQKMGKSNSPYYAICHHIGDKFKRQNEKPKLWEKAFSSAKAERHKILQGKILEILEREKLGEITNAEKWEQIMLVRPVSKS